MAEGAVLTQGAAPQGCFYPPTLVTNVEPASILASEEIFGPVVTLTAFRTPDDAVALANNTRYGLAASVWSENVNLAIDIAAKVKAGVVWINCANVFDASAGFGGYRESGSAARAAVREWRPISITRCPTRRSPRRCRRLRSPPRQAPSPRPASTARQSSMSAASRRGPIAAIPMWSRVQGHSVGLAGLGNRKDIRNAVEAARKAEGWGVQTGHNRAQVLYYLAENLSARAADFEERLKSFGRSAEICHARSGNHAPPHFLVRRSGRQVRWRGSPDQNRPCDARDERASRCHRHSLSDRPTASWLRLAGPAGHCHGQPCRRNSVADSPLAATELYQVFDTSDVPGGVVNIVTGERDVLIKTLADHDDVEAVWYFGTAAGGKAVEEASAGNLKQTWTEDGAARDWDGSEGRGACSSPARRK